MFEIPVSVSLPNIHFPSNLSLLFKYYVPSIKILRNLIKKTTKKPQPCFRPNNLSPS